MFVKTFMTIETKDPEEIRRILDHHIDWLINMDKNRNIIDSVSDVVSYETASKYDRNKLRILVSVISDILQTKPSDSILDPDDDEDLIDLYHNLSKVKANLEDLGYSE